MLCLRSVTVGETWRNAVPSPWPGAGGKIAVACQKTINTFTRKVYFVYGVSCS